MSGSRAKKSTLAIVAAAAVATLALAAPASAQQVKLGTLQCNVAPSVGLILGSSKAMACTYSPSNGGRPEFYDGSLDRLGIDIGFTQQQVVGWVVFAPVTAGYAPGALAGTYAGGSAEATVGLGLGANVLVGGFGRSFVLQPVSVSGQAGLNIAAGVAAMTLRAR